MTHEMKSKVKATKSQSSKKTSFLSNKKLEGHRDSPKRSKGRAVKNSCGQN